MCLPDQGHPERWTRAPAEEPPGQYVRAEHVRHDANNDQLLPNMLHTEGWPRFGMAVLLSARSVRCVARGAGR